MRPLGFLVHLVKLIVRICSHFTDGHTETPGEAQTGRVEGHTEWLKPCPKALVLPEVLPSTLQPIRHPPQTLEHKLPL